jgi:biopolymer transport protein ExbD
MGIRFECINCHKKIVVHDRFANRRIKCPGCEFPLTVPTVSEIMDATPAVEPIPNANLNTPQSPLHSDASGHSGSSDQDIVPAAMVSAREPLPSEQPAASSLPPKSSSSDAISGSKGLGAGFSLADYTGDAEEDASPPPRPPKRLERESAEEEDVEWDITPMVDVAFLLLIFFMLTASFSIQKAIPTSAEPEDKPSSNSVQRERSDQPDSFVIQIDEYNAYTVISNDGGTSEATSKQELIVQLKDLKTQLGDASPRVNIQAHTMSIHGAVVACMDAAREAGFDSFQMQSVEDFD